MANLTIVCLKHPERTQIKDECGVLLYDRAGLHPFVALLRALKKIERKAKKAAK